MKDTARRPLLPVEAVVFMVNRDGDEIAADCERGFFKFAFDISAPGAVRREIRIFRDCVLKTLQPELALPEKLEEVFERIFPRRDLRGVELQRTLSCSLGHIRDLDDAALISVARERLAASGPRASRVYSRDSIIAFLKSRSIGGNPLTN